MARVTPDCMPTPTMPYERRLCLLVPGLVRHIPIATIAALSPVTLGPVLHRATPRRGHRCCKMSPRPAKGSSCNHRARRCSGAPRSATAFALGLVRRLVAAEDWSFAQRNGQYNKSCKHPPPAGRGCAARFARLGQRLSATDPGTRQAQSGLQAVFSKQHMRSTK